MASLVGLLLVVGCSAFENMECLKEQPVKEASEGFMDNVENIESVLFSSYYQLKRYNCFSRYYPIIVEAMSDYCNGNGSYASASNYEGLDPTLTSRKRCLGLHVQGNPLREHRDTQCS